MLCLQGYVLVSAEGRRIQLGVYANKEGKSDALNVVVSNKGLAELNSTCFFVVLLCTAYISSP